MHNDFIDSALGTPEKHEAALETMRSARSRSQTPGYGSINEENRLLVSAGFLLRGCLIFRGVIYE